MSENDDWATQFLQRVESLKESSLDSGHAAQRAHLEELIRKWPSGWGNDLVVVIYGDFVPPDSEVRDERLRITVHPEKLENTVVRSALCALKATIAIDDKSIESILDAIRRLNLLLGAMTLTSWGNNQVGWWCHLTHGNDAGISTDWKIDEILNVTNNLCDLRADVQQRVSAALYWMRANPVLILQQNGMPVFRSYTDRWNAFECLVEAVLLLQPEPSVPKAEKQQAIDSYIQERASKLSPGDIDDMYHSIINPGFVGKAKHVLRVCFQKDADAYIYECFERTDTENRLYQVRNSINHGDIDVEKPEEVMRIQSRLSRLHMMLLQMFGRLVPYSCPANEGFTRHVDRRNESPSM